MSKRCGYMLRAILLVYSALLLVAVRCEDLAGTTAAAQPQHGRWGGRIIWSGNSARRCDFRGNTMAQSYTSSSQQCSVKCESTTGCSHYVWTKAKRGGTCWLKKGTVTKADAVYVKDKFRVCGVVPRPLGGCGSRVSNPLLGVCYDPMHLDAYSVAGAKSGALAAAMDREFEFMSSIGIQYVRTYYSNYFAVPIAPIAAKHNIKLYLGVYVTEQDWYSSQVNSAVEAATNSQTSDYIEAILVGNEDLNPRGRYTAANLVDKITDVRNKLQGARKPPVGTVQRINEWLNTSIVGLDSLKQSADIIGVNIYTIFDGNGAKEQPDIEGLKNQWANLFAKYGSLSSKLRITETGYASYGMIPGTNVPFTLEHAQAYYKGVMDWLPSYAADTQGQPLFYFEMYDRRPDDQTVKDEFERHFGLYTYQGTDKCIVGQ